jgi:deoxyribodipyrimidine photo-lyase
MWLASYVVHWRKVRWQAGARWFLRHLLDGDPASNNLSWQWVASAFSVKPYIFNRANLERFSGGRYCGDCPRAGAGGASRPGGCPFESSYENLQARLFGRQGADPSGDSGRGSLRDAAAMAMLKGKRKGTEAASLPQAEATHWDRFKAPILWIHEESLGPTSSPLHRHPQRPAVFVLEPDPISLRRLGFLYECLLELPVTIRCGEESGEVLAFAKRHDADGVVTSAAVNPRLAEIRARIAAEIPVEVVEPEPFVALSESCERPLDLGRFSRYWRRAEPLVWDLW